MGEMNVLITGSDGFIGSKITEYLAKYNYNILALTFNKYNIPDILSKFNNVKALDVNLNENISLNNVLKSYKFDVIIHTAFVTSYKSFYDINNLHVNVNLISTYKFIQYAINHNVNKFIFLSSAGIYYNQNKENINSENRKIRTDTFYFLNKNNIENLIKYYQLYQLDTKFIILRVGTIFGENERESTFRRNLSIPIRILRKVKENELIKLNTLNVFRDYCYINNVSYAVSKIIEYNNLNHLIYNVGSDEVYGINAIFNILFKNGIKFKYQISKKENCDIILNSSQNRSALNLTRLRKVVSDYPLINFENGILKAYGNLKIHNDL